MSTGNHAIATEPRSVYSRWQNNDDWDDMEANGPRFLIVEGLVPIPMRPLVSIEVPRGSFTKRKPDGSVDFVAPFPCPYNYGSVEGTRTDDGDPLDALVLGRRLPYGARISTHVRLVMGFLDDGVSDPKVVCSPHPLSRAQRVGVVLFFSVYARFKRNLYRLRSGVHGETRMLGWLPMVSADATSSP